LRADADDGLENFVLGLERFGVGNDAIHALFEIVDLPLEEGDSFVDGFFVISCGQILPIDLAKALENTRRNALSFLGKTCHDETMENPRHLRDTYRFPGLAPAALVQGYPGDPKAIILPLRRRRKKRFAATVGKRIPRSTTNVPD
jgi:hypothetical protein